MFIFSEPGILILGLYPKEVITDVQKDGYNRSSSQVYNEDLETTNNAVSV